MVEDKVSGKLTSTPNIKFVTGIKVVDDYLLLLVSCKLL